MVIRQFLIIFPSVAVSNLDIFRILYNLSPELWDSKERELEPTKFFHKYFH